MRRGNRQQEWTSDQVGKLRRLMRAGWELERALEEIGSTLTLDGARQRMRRLSIPYPRKGSNHMGTSRLLTGQPHA